MPPDSPGAPAEMVGIDPFSIEYQGKRGITDVPGVRLKEARARLQVRMETWELPNLEIARALDHLSDEVAVAKLRDEWMAGKEGVALKWCPAIAIDARTSVTISSVTERMFPTEYETPESFTNSSATKDKPKPEASQAWIGLLGHFLTPTAFEARNTGQTLEAAVYPVEIDPTCWDTTLSLEDTQLPGMASFGPPELHADQPQFTSFRTGSLLRLKEGEWRLVSVMDPPRGISPTTSGKQFVTLVRIDRTGP